MKSPMRRVTGLNLPTSLGAGLNGGGGARIPACEGGRPSARDCQDGRLDSSIELSAGLALRQIHIAGLSPIVRFSHSDNRSSLTIYSFRRNRIEFGLTGDF
jgi:Surface lipoprotein assembly modifier